MASAVDVVDEALTPSALPPSPGLWRSTNIARRARRLSSLVILVLAWEAYSRFSGNALVPSTATIGRRLWSDITSGDLWFHGKLTLQRGFLGLFLAVVLGTLIGFVMARSRWFDAAAEPLLGATYPIPKLALYPVFLLLLGLGGTSKVCLVILECLYPMVYNAYAGARAIDRNQLWLARNVGASRWRVFKDLTVPATLPSVMAGVRIASPIMLVVMVVTEMLGESRGLGYMIRNAQANFEPEGALAVVVVLGVFGFLLDRLIVWATRRLAFWERGVQL